MSESFTRMVENGQTFGQMLSNLTKEFEVFLIKTLVFKRIASAFSGSGGFLGVIGSFFGGLAAPGRATGGPVSAGSLYRVGERGPEYFVPNVAGKIVPAAAGGGKTSILNYSPRFNINTPNADSFRKSQAQILSEGYRQMVAMHARNA